MAAIEAVRKVAKLLRGKEGKVEEDEVETIDVRDLLREVRCENTELQDLLYNTPWLRSLCVRNSYSDEFQLRLIDAGNPVMSLREFNEIWSKSRPRDGKRISSKDRIVLRDIFNAVAKFENVPIESKNAEEEKKGGEIEVEEGKDAQGGDARLIFAQSILESLKQKVEIRAMCSTCDWLDSLLWTDIFKSMSAIVPQELDFEMFIQLLESCLSIERHLKVQSSTMNPLLLEAALSQPGAARTEWPIESYHRVTHKQVEQLAAHWEIDPESEPYLLWLVKQALETALPSEWEVVRHDETGETVFRNTMTEETKMEHPASRYFSTSLKHERQQLQQLREFGAINSDYEPSKAWMQFSFPVLINDEDGQHNGMVSYYYCFSTKSARGVPPEPEEGFLLKDDNGLLSSMVTQSFPIRQNVDMGVFNGKDKPKPLGRKSKKRINVSEVETLSFRSWWNDSSLQPDGPSKRYLDLFYHVNTGNVQVIIQGTDRIFTFSHLVGKGGVVQPQDLHIGTKLNILGRSTTLMQASLETIEWIHHHERKYRAVWNKLKKELLKYDATRRESERIQNSKPFSHGRANLREYIKDIKVLRDRLAMYRPKLATRLVRDTLAPLIE